MKLKPLLSKLKTFINPCKDKFITTVLTDDYFRMSVLGIRQKEAIEMFESLNEKPITSTDVHNRRRAIIKNYNTLKKIDDFIVRLDVITVKRLLDADDSVYDEKQFLQDMLEEEREEEINYYFNYLIEYKNSPNVTEHLNLLKEINVDRHEQFLNFVASRERDVTH